MLVIAVWPPRCLRQVQGSQPSQPVELPPGALDVLSPRLGYDVAATVDTAGASSVGTGGSSGSGGGGVTRDRGLGAAAGDGSMAAFEP